MECFSAYKTLLEIASEVSEKYESGESLDSFFEKEIKNIQSSNNSYYSYLVENYRSLLKKKVIDNIKP